MCVDARLDRALDSGTALLDRIADRAGILGQFAQPPLDERPFERDLQGFAVDDGGYFDGQVGRDADVAGNERDVHAAIVARSPPRPTK